MTLPANGCKDPGPRRLAAQPVLATVLSVGLTDGHALALHLASETPRLLVPLLAFPWHPCPFPVTSPTRRTPVPQNSFPEHLSWDFTWSHIFNSIQTLTSPVCIPRVKSEP